MAKNFFLFVFLVISYILNGQGTDLVIQKGHSGPIYSLAIDEQGKILASGSKNGTVILYDLSVGKQFMTIDVNHPVFKMYMSLNCNDLWIDGEVYDIYTGLEKNQIKQSEMYKSLFRFIDTTNVIKGILKEFKNDGKVTLLDWGSTTDRKKIVCVGSEGADMDTGIIRIYDSENANKINEIKAHSKGIIAFALSTDKRILATAGMDKTINIWEFPSLKHMGQINDAHNDEINDLTFHPRDSYLISCSSDRTIKFWDIDKLKEIKVLEIPSNKINSIDQNNLLLAGGFGDNSIKIFDLKTCVSTTIIPGLTMNSPYERFKEHLTGYMGDGIPQKWYSKYMDNNAKVSYQTGCPDYDEHQVPIYPGLEISAFSLSSDQSKLAVATEDTTIRIFDFLNFNDPFCLDQKNFTDQIGTLLFSPSGGKLVSIDKKGKMGIWICNKWEKVVEIMLDSLPLKICFDKSEDDIAILLTNGQCKIINAMTYKVRKVLSVKDSFFSSVSFHPQKRELLLGTSDGKIYVYNTSDYSLVRSFYSHDEKITSMKFTEDGSLLLTSGWDKKIKIWNYDNFNCLREIEMNNRIKSVDIDNNHLFLTALNEDDTHTLWFDYFRSGNKMQNITMPFEFSMGLDIQFSNDGKLILHKMKNGMLCIDNLYNSTISSKLLLYPFNTFIIIGSGGIDASPSLFPYIKFVSDSCDPNDLFLRFYTPKFLLRKLIPKHFDEVQTVKFSSDGNQLISGSKDGSIKFWWKTNGKFLAELIDNCPISSIATSTDGKYFLSSNWDKIVKVWDLQNGRLVRKIKTNPMPGSINTTGNLCDRIALSPDGRIIAVGSMKTSFYDFETGDLLKSFDNQDASFERPVTFSSTKNLFATSSGFDVQITDYVKFNKMFKTATDLNEITSLNFSYSGTQLACGDLYGKIQIIDLNTQKVNKILSGHLGYINQLVFSQDDKFLISASKDNTIRIWNIKKNEEVVKLVSFGNSDFISITPDNYYRSTKNGTKVIAFRIGKRLFGFEQFDLKYNRPDIVLERIGYSTPELIDAYRNAYYKRLKKMGFTEDKLKGDFHVPEIEIQDKNKIEPNTISGKVEFKITANDSIENLDRINVWVNGIPVYGMAGIDLRSMNTHSTNRNIVVELTPGSNKIEVSALNQAGAESLKDLLSINNASNAKKPELYLVALGVSEFQDTSKNLRYSVKDGRDIVKLFAGSKELYGMVHIDTLFNENVTRENVLKLKEELKNSRVGDRVVMFLSGHGLLDLSQDFYYATSDMDFDAPEKHGILYDDIEGVLDGIPARDKLLLIDACHSGELDKEGELKPEEVAVDRLTGTKRGLVKYTIRGTKNIEGIGLQNSFELMQELFANLSRGSGAVVISAAAGNGWALENDKWKNGAFTYTLLNGLRNNLGAVDKNGNKEVSVTELKDYVITEVEKLTNGAQKPTCRRENLEMDWRVW